MKQRELKAKQDCSFLLSSKHRKCFSNIICSVNSPLQKWIIYHPCVIQSRIENSYVKVELYEVNEGAKTELRHKVLLQISVHEICIYVLKKNAIGFSVTYDDKAINCISDSDIRLLLPHQILKIPQSRQIMCG